MKKFLIYLCLSLTVAVVSCKKESAKPIDELENHLLKISEAYAIGAAVKVEVWSESGLKTGYQRLYVALYDSVSNTRIHKANVEITPVMDMNNSGQKMSHSAPAENPQTDQAENMLFPCAAVFTMPSNGSDGAWRLLVMVKKEGQSKAGKADIPLVIKQSEPERVKTITTKDGSRLTIAYILPVKPKMGINDFEVSIHRRKDMMNFPADGTYSLTVTPEMPSMGHGSPNNINPVHIKNGHYRGKVNFTMTGDWRINIDLSKDGETDSVFFDLLF